MDRELQARMDAFLTRCRSYGERLAAQMKTNEQEEATRSNQASLLTTTTTNRSSATASAPPSSSSPFTLLPHQVHGVRWLTSLFQTGMNGILADDMGLGKTVQIAAYLSSLYRDHRYFGTHLIVVPLSTMTNWQRELERWCPFVPVCVYHGNAQHRADQRVWLRRRNTFCKKNADKIQSQVRSGVPIERIVQQVGCVVLTTYDMLLVEKGNLNSAGLAFDLLIVDEAHRLKNMNCRLLAKLNQLQVEGRILLTGTPLQNNIAELWSMMHFVMPEVFGDAESFAAWFEYADHVREAEERELSRQQEHDVLRQLKQQQEQQQRKDIIMANNDATGSNDNMQEEGKETNRTKKRSRLEMEGNGTANDNNNNDEEHGTNGDDGKATRDLNTKQMSAAVTGDERAKRWQETLDVLRRSRSLPVAADTHPAVLAPSSSSSSASSEEAAGAPAPPSAAVVVRTLQTRFLTPSRATRRHPLQVDDDDDDEYGSASCNRSKPKHTPKLLRLLSATTGKDSGDEEENDDEGEPRGGAASSRRLLMATGADAAAAAPDSELRDYLHHAVRTMHEVLQPFVLRRTKSEIPTLKIPPKYEVILSTPLLPLQQTYYEQVQTRGTFANNRLMHLRKVCCHPFLFPQFAEERQLASSHQDVDFDELLELDLSEVTDKDRLVAYGTIVMDELSLILSHSAKLTVVFGMLQRLWLGEARVNELREEQKQKSTASKRSTTRSNPQHPSDSLQPSFSSFPLRAFLGADARDGTIRRNSGPTTPTTSVSGGSGRSSHKILLFSQMTRALDIIELMLSLWNFLIKVQGRLDQLTATSTTAASSSSSSSVKNGASEGVFSYSRLDGKETVESRTLAIANFNGEVVTTTSTQADTSSAERSNNKNSNSASPLEDEEEQRGNNKKKNHHHRSVIERDDDVFLTPVKTAGAAAGDAAFSEPNSEGALPQPNSSSAQGTFLFLISTRSGGVGLNLVAADTVILFDSDFNPHNDKQAIDRCHRIGQTRPVVVYRLAAPNTVEDILFQASKRKLHLERVIIGSGSFLHTPDAVSPNTPTASSSSHMVAAAPSTTQKPEGDGDAAAAGGGNSHLAFSSQPSSLQSSSSLQLTMPMDQQQQQQQQATINEAEQRGGGNRNGHLSTTLTELQLDQLVNRSAVIGLCRANEQ